MAYKFKSLDQAPATAYKALQLVDPADRDSSPDRFLDLGTFRIIESEAAVKAVIDAYIRELVDVSGLIEKDIDERTDAAELDQLYNEFQKRCVLSYDDFIRFVGHEDAERKKTELGQFNKGAKQVRVFARESFARMQGYGGYARSFTGYKKYLKAIAGKLYDTLSQDLPALVKEQPRTEHTYIISTTGTGKTELLKAICLNYVQQPDYAGVVILDPGGDMAPQMARWMELIPTSQLVYIDPLLSKFNVPVINPFDAEDLSEQDRNLLTDHIVLALASLLATKSKRGGDFSVNMDAILYPCVRLLVDLPNTSLLDLQKLMKDDAELIAAGKSFQDPKIADFFLTEFTGISSYKTTKESIVVKLRNLLSKGVLDKVLCGRTSINLERLMAERKFIIVNLAEGQLGKTESTALGTLIVSLIQAIAMKRKRLKETERPMTHLIIDECQNFVTPSIKDIIRGTRKFGLALTLAQQEVGGEMPDDIASVVTKTTNVKVAGRSSDPDETKRSGKLVGVPADEIINLDPGVFYWKNGTAPPFLLHVRSDRLSYKGGISNELWVQVMERQQRYFYRRLDGQEHRPIDSQEPAPAGKRKYEFD